MSYGLYSLFNYGRIFIESNVRSFSQWSVYIISTFPKIARCFRKRHCASPLCNLLSPVILSFHTVLTYGSKCSTGFITVGTSRYWKLLIFFFVNSCNIYHIQLRCSRMETLNPNTYCTKKLFVIKIIPIERGLRKQYQFEFRSKKMR